MNASSSSKSALSELLDLQIQLEYIRIDIESAFATHFSMDPQSVTKEFLRRFHQILSQLHDKIPNQIQLLVKDNQNRKRSFTNIPSSNSSSWETKIWVTKIDLSRLQLHTKNDDIFKEQYEEFIQFFGLLKENTPEGAIVALRAVKSLKTQVAFILENPDGRVKSNVVQIWVNPKDVAYLTKRYNDKARSVKHRGYFF